MSFLLSKLFSGYFFLRQRLPFLIYFIYCYYERSYDNKCKNYKLEIMILLTLCGIGTLLGITFIGLYLNIKFYDLFGMYWQYPALIQWSLTFFIYFIGVYYKTGNTLKAYIISILVTVGGGWLYEIPFFHPFYMFFSGGSIFYIRSQILYLLLFSYELFKLKFKVNKYIFIGFMIYLFFSLCSFLMGTEIVYGYYRLWYYRLPTILFLLSLISGIDKK